MRRLGESLETLQDCTVSEQTECFIELLSKHKGYFDNYTSSDSSACFQRVRSLEAQTGGGVRALTDMAS